MKVQSVAVGQVEHSSVGTLLAKATGGAIDTTAMQRAFVELIRPIGTIVQFWKHPITAFVSRLIYTTSGDIIRMDEVY